MFGLDDNSALLNLFATPVAPKPAIQWGKEVTSSVRAHSALEHHLLRDREYRETTRNLDDWVVSIHDKPSTDAIADADDFSMVGCGLWLLLQAEFKSPLISEISSQFPIEVKNKVRMAADDIMTEFKKKLVVVGLVLKEYYAR